MSSDGPAPGSVIGEKFKLLRQLGAGGMGAVYEIEHLFTHHRRALKLLHGNVLGNAAAVERFLREASAAGRIGNPHIVETFDAGRLPTGEPYLVMELLQGRDLTHEIAAHGRLPVDAVAHLLRQACHGIAAAHEAGVVHRDLKPDNLFVTERDGRPFVKILDFGISKFDAALTGDHAVTREGSMLGTPYYMAPEQVRGAKDLDARADVYALGVIAYEAASGERPFEAETLPELIVRIHEGKPTPLGERCPDLPQSFCRVVEKAMATDRETRFASVRELGEALEPFERAEARDAYAATLAIEESALPAAAPPPSGTVLLPAAQAATADPSPSRVPLDPSGNPASIEAAALGRTVGQPALPQRSRLRAGAVLALLLALGVGALVFGQRRAVPTTPSAEAASAPLTETSVLPASAAPSLAVPTSSAPVPAPSSSIAPVSSAKIGAASAKPTPSKDAAPATSTKAKAVGLDEKNPY